MIRKGIPLRLEQKENDSQISHDDCVEIFLNGSPKGRTYLQLGQSAAGVRFDAEVRGGASQVNRNWSSSLWKNAAGRTSDFYDAEFAIPLKMLPLDGSGFLRFNLTRTVRAGGNAICIDGISRPDDEIAFLPFNPVFKTDVVFAWSAAAPKRTLTEEFLKVLRQRISQAQSFS